MIDSSGYAIGSDISTSSCKTVLLDPEARVVAAFGHAYRSHHPKPGWVEQDPNIWYEAFCSTVQRVLDSSAVLPAKIAAVCIVGVTHNPVLLDSGGNLLRPAVHFWDKRSVEQAGQIKERWGQQIWARSFNEVDSLWTWPQLLWIRQHEPEIWKRIDALMFTKDYVRHRLIHDRHNQKIQPSNISDCIDPVGTLLFDPQSSKWIEEFIGDFGLPFVSLPAPKPAISIARKVGSEGAADTGLLPGTPVITGTTDTAAEVLGSGALESGRAILKLASVGRIMVVMDRPLDDPHSLNYPHVFEDLWYPGSVTKHGAAAHGAGLLAAMAIDLLPREAVALDIYISIDHICEPDVTRQNLYQQIYKGYLEDRLFLASLYHQSEAHIIS